jgi:hypothetical protein
MQLLHERHEPNLFEFAAPGLFDDDQESMILRSSRVYGCIKSTSLAVRHLRPTNEASRSLSTSTGLESNEEPGD